MVHGFFMEAKAVGPRVCVEVGFGFFVEMEEREAIAFLGKRLEVLEKMDEEWTQRVEDKTKMVEEMRGALQKLQGYLA